MWSLFLHLSDRYLIGQSLWLVSLFLALRWMLKARRRFRDRPKARRNVHVGLSIWLGLLSLTGIELGFALLYDTTDSFDMTNVSHRWFQVHVAPDLKVLGFKDGTGIEYRDDVLFPTTDDVSEDRQHLCFLGDSFTFGHGVPRVADRFSNQLRTRLNAEAKTQGKNQFAVSNLSKPGSDLLWSEAVLQRVLDDGHHVDTALYVMCLNDIEMFHDRRMDFNNELAAWRQQPRFFLWKDTYFFNWAYYRSAMFQRSSARNYYDFVREFYAGPAWTEFETVLLRAHRMTRQRKTRLVVVVFPFLHNLGASYPFDAVHQQITTACRSHEIDCIDLLPALREHAGERLTVNPFDAHPNERAHAIVAESLHQSLP